MRFSFITPIIMMLLPAIVQAGNAFITNKCRDSVYVWSVSSSVSPKTTITWGGQYEESYRVDPKSGGIALKITTVDNGLFTPNTPQTVLSYSIDGDHVWYDLSDVGGDAFAGRRVVLHPDNPNCDSIIWPRGIPPTGSNIKACDARYDVELILCA